MATDLRLVLPFALSVLLASATAQDLRRALVAADAVVVARQVGKTAHGAELATDSVVRFAQMLAASAAGAPPTDTANALVTTALQGDAAVRTEAAKYLTERPDLRAKLLALQWSQLVTRAAGETDDVPFK